MPKTPGPSKGVNGAILFMFFFPVLISLISDLQGNGKIDWFGFVAGGVGMVYVIFALPLWFRKPNPVIFVPCSFAALVLYLHYINSATGGSWFLSFAFQVVGGLCLIVSAVVTLLRYLRKGRLYIWGGAFIAFGGFMIYLAINHTAREIITRKLFF